MVYKTPGTSGFEPAVDEATRRALLDISRRIDASASGTALNDLTDVNAPAPSNDQVLTWNTATSKWINQSPGAVVIPDPLLLSNGSAGAPTYSFASDPDTGVYRAGVNQLGFSAGGTQVLQLTTTDVDVTTGHLNVISNAAAQTISLGGWSSNGSYAAIESSPMVILMGNTGSINDATYIRNKGTGALYLGTNGSNDLWITNGGAISTVGNLTVGGDLDIAAGVISNVNEIFADVGTQSDPSYTFDGNATTGMYLDGTSLGFTVGGSRKGVFSNDRLYLYGGTGNSDYIGPINSSYFYNVTSSSFFYFNKEIRVSNALTSHSGTLQLQDRDTRVIQLDGAAGANGNAIVYQAAHSGTLWNNAGQQAALRILPMASDPESAGGIAGILWQTTYSTDRHVHARVFWNSGDTMTWRNYENTAWTGHDALDFTVMSSSKEKARIRTARDERGVLDFAVPGPKDMAFAQIRKVRPVLFDNLQQERLWEWAGCPGCENKTDIGSDEEGMPIHDIEEVVHATRDECNECGCSGADNMVSKQHHCDDYICGGTKEVPCGLIEMHVDRVGLIAEELNEVFPKAVKKDAYGDPIGIRYDVVTVELLNIVQHILEDRDECRTREAREITARRSVEAQLQNLQDRLAVLEQVK